MNVNVWDVTGPIGDLVRSGRPAGPRAAGRPRRPAAGRAGRRRLTTLPGVPEPGTHERGPARPGVPAARQVLALLQALARQPGAVPAAALARDLGLPRSTTYHLLAELVDAGFVVHLPEERRYGLGVSAFEIGSAYSRQEPLARLARPLLARLVDAVGNSAHLAVLHGREVLYVVEQRAPGRPPLVTDVGVRLPAQLTASGRAMLADLPPAQVRALFPDADRLRRPARLRPGPAVRAAPAAGRRPAGRARRRGRRGDAGLRVGGRGGARPRRPAGGQRRGHLPRRGRRRPGPRGAGPPGRPRGGGADPADQRPPARRLRPPPAAAECAAAGRGTRRRAPWCTLGARPAQSSGSRTGAMSAKTSPGPGLSGAVAPPRWCTTPHTAFSAVCTAPSAQPAVQEMSSPARNSPR